LRPVWPRGGVVERLSVFFSDGVIWGEETLDHFIENPLKAVPGTKMGYAGVKDPKERADLIAYLKQATSDPKLCE
jgi:cytochrome c